MLEAALALLAEGRSVFPVRIRRTPTGFSKEPLVSQRPMKQRFSAEQLRALWPADANGIGMELGKVSGVMRLDDEGCPPWDEIGEQPASGLFSTPSGGRGWLIEYVDGCKTDTIWKGSGHAELRLMSDGTYTVVPPSEGYAWITPGVAKLPLWLLDRQAGKILRELTEELRPTTREPETEEVAECLRHIPAEDYHTWIQVGMALKESGYDVDVWEEWSKTAANYEEGVCLQKWATFQKTGRVVTARSLVYIAQQHGFELPNKHEPLTDVGNGRILARTVRGKLLWHVNYEKWVWYNGVQWDAESGYIHAEKAAKAVVQVRYDAALKSLRKAQQQEDAKAKVRGCAKVLAWCVQSQDASHISKMLRMCRSEASMHETQSTFDTHPMLLNCPNGTLDLQARELREHLAEDRLTQLCPTAYNCAAECQRWERFLVEVFNDAELISYLQRFLGYCLTGSTEHHVLPVWYGTGRNGKGTIVRALERVLGSDFVTVLSSGYLAEQKNRPHDTKFMTLRNKRIAIDMETGDNMRLNEEIVKRLTGGDSIAGHWMCQDEESFRPTHKLILATNYEPTIRNQDVAIWSRIQKLPFAVSFAGREEPDLDATLAAEAEGILRWLVEGCYKWQDEGLNPPAAVVTATAAYQAQQNTVTRFLEEMTQPGSAEQRTLKGTITAAYKAWCQLHSVQPVGPTAFGKAMTAADVGGDKNYYNLVLRR